MYNYFDAKGSQVTPDTVSHYKYKQSIRRCMRQNQGSILVLYGSLSFLFSYGIFIESENQRDGVPVVWIKIISYQMLRTAFLFYRHKQTK
jgi:hypothetical protein